MSYYDFPHTRTYDSDLGWLIKQTKHLLECCDAMNDWKTEHEEAYEELRKFYTQLITGNFPDDFITGLEKWFTVHGRDLIGELVKMVFFGITDDGYFIAYIPDNWDDIIFGTTGLDDFPAGYDYGRLTLSFNI